MKPNVETKQYFAAFYQNNRLLWVVVMVLNLLQIPLMVAVAQVLGNIIDAISVGELAALARTAIRVAVLFVVNIALDLSLGFSRATFIKRALTQYKSFAFKKLAEKRISAFFKENTGRYISVFNNDVATIETGYLAGTFELVYQILSFVVTLAVLLFYSPLLTGITIALCVLPIIVSVLSGGKLAGKTKAESDQNELFVAKIKDLLTGFPVIKSFKAERETATIFDKDNAVTESTKCSRKYTEEVIGAVSNASSIILQFGIFFMGAIFAINGKITTGTVMVFVQMSGYIINAIAKIPQLTAGRAAAKGLVEKLAGIIAENAEKSGEAIAPKLESAIELKNLTFAYEPGKPVLRDVSMRFEKGKKYAIVGGSGSGKSTILNLMMGAYSGYSGSLAVDGRELGSIDPDSLYDLCSLIDQNVFLFDDTIERNITMFRDFPSEKVTAAESRAGLFTLMAQKGVDYRCGENGVNLSGGERQRISIARCLLRETPVLLLDEATAALDNETAFAITDSILSLDGLTRVVVTHRLEKPLLEKYDEIFVLKNGAVCERGTFGDLMASAGYFYSLYTVSN